MSNSALGMKKVYISLLLMMIADIIVEFANLFFSDEKFQIVNGIMGSAAVILVLVCAVIRFLGLMKAAPDDKGYKTAYELAVCAILAILLTIALNAIWPDVIKTSSDGLLFRIISLFIAYFVIETTTNRLEAAGCDKEAKTGNEVLYIVCFAYLAEAVAAIIGLAVKEGKVIGIVNDVVKFLSLFATAYFANFLGKACKKL